MKLIYLAVPYSHFDVRVRLLRYQAAVRAVEALMAKGRLVLCGRIYVQQLNTSDDPDALWPLFRELIDRCDELWVLMLDGHQESAGIAREVAHATASGKPVFYVEAFA